MFYEKYTLESNDIKDMMKFYGEACDHYDGNPVLELK